MARKKDYIEEVRDGRKGEKEEEREQQKEDCELGVNVISHIHICRDISEFST